MVSHRPCHFAPLSPLLPLVLTPQPPPHHPIQVDAAAGPSQHARPWAQFGPVPFNPFLFLIHVFKSQKLDETSKIHRKYNKARKNMKYFSIESLRADTSENIAAWCRTSYYCIEPIENQRARLDACSACY
jgi:hypothetical protein